MNARSYRLVFSKRLGMHVPVSEVQHAQGKKRKARLAAMMMALVVPAWAATPAPTEVPSGAKVRSGTIGFNQTGNTLNINQTSQNGIIHWNTFNIGTHATVNFNQPNATAATLNRVVGADQSIIQGALNATGAVYVINRNGILFDKGSQINLHSLVASTLDIQSDDLFLKGFLTQTATTPAFSDDYTNYTGSAVPGTVTVAEGASITASSNGRILLLAPDVTNNGIVSSPGGQVILAAGHKAYFHVADGSDPSLLRGLTVEVASGGTALNLGQLAADSGGDVTLIGKLVKQDGMVSASTTVNLNGSIHLLAMDISKPLTPKTLNNLPVADESGTVEIGANSSTAVLPALDAAKVAAAIAAGKLTQDQVDAYRSGRATAANFYAYLPDTTIQDAQVFNPSTIKVEGKNIWVQGGAALVAPSGDITLRVTALTGPTAADDFLTRGQDTAPFDTYANSLCTVCRLEVDDGAILDVSGLQNVAIAMDRNVVTAQLRGDELKDAPLLRGVNNPNYGPDTATGNNPIYAANIQVDIRNTATVDLNGQSVTRQGTPLADVSGYIAQIGRKIDEKSTAAGSVHLYSEGEVVVQKGAVIDLAGGSLAYQSGTISTTQLLYNGTLVDIAAATPDKLYQGLGPNKVVYEQGYLEGKNAGGLEVVAPWTVLQGTMDGSTVTGIHQRSTLPRAASLTLGIDHTGGSGERDFRLLDAVSFSNAGQSAAPAWGVALPDDLKGTLVLDPVMLKAANIGQLNVYTNNAISLSAGQILDLGAAGSLVMSAGAIDLGGEILAPGGSVKLKSTLTVWDSLAITFGWNDLGLDQSLTVDGSAQIDTAGLWTNDAQSQNTASKVELNGGTINLTAQGTMNVGGLLDASAGAWLKSDGKTLAAGHGGDIALTDNYQPMKLLANPRSYGVLDSTGKASKGGKLTLSTLGVAIGGSDAGLADTLWLPADYFATGGFSGYDITALGDLAVANDTVVAPRTWTRVLSSAQYSATSGSDIAAFSSPAPLAWGVPKNERPVANLSLTSQNKLTLGAGASIAADPLATISLAAMTRLDVEGSVSAPGGSVNLTLNPYVGLNGATGYPDGAAIWLGASAQLSVAGTAKTWQASSGILQGSVLAGGNLNLTSNEGAIVALPGSVLDVSGASGWLDLPQSNGAYVRTLLPSAAGSITLAAAEGIFLGADLRASGGSPSAAKGSLSVVLDRPDIPPADSVTYPYPMGIRSMELYGSLPAFPVDPLAVANDGIARLAASQLANFDQVSLKSRDQIVFKDNFSLTLRGNLGLDSPDIVVADAATVALNAQYINLGNQDPLYQTAGSQIPAAGTGQFSAQAGLIDLMGHFALSGASQVNLGSDGDIRLSGVIAYGDTTLTPLGQLTTAGNLKLTSAQVYPTTLSDFTLESSKVGGEIDLYGLGVVPQVPLAGGGQVTIQADNIVQGGVLRAPLGKLVLDARDTLTLADGSLTSVSAEGAYIPYGRVQNGLSWVYDVNVGTQANTITVFSGADGIVNLPVKDVELKGAVVAQSSGARIDLSGGGDLVGSEFTPGPGGSSDYLTQAGVYAILPADTNTPAPFDFQNSAYAYTSANASSRKLGSGASQRVAPGQSIYLSGIPGLAAGYYTLLPGQYALLPGAFSVRAVANTQDMAASQNVQRPDGSYLVAGYETSLGSTDTGTVRWSGFEIAPRQTVTSRPDYSFQYTADQLAAQKNTGRSEITDYLASQLIPSVAANYDLVLPTFAPDAGHLGISAQTSLTLDGDISFARPTGAQGGELDISAPKIAVINNGVNAPDGYLSLDVNRLDAFQVDSLMLGGVRVATGDAASVYVDQGASDILLDTAGAALTGPEIMLVASHAITLTGNSQIRGEGAAKLSKQTLVFGREQSLDTNGLVTDPGVVGDGALLRVASGGLREVVRHQVTLAQGDLSIGSHATVYGSGSVTLDDTHSSDILGSVGLGSGGALEIGASRISLGQVSTVAQGTIVDAALLAALGQPSQFVLKSYSSIDVYGDATLGGAATQNLSLEAAGIVGKTSGTLGLAAQTVSLANPDGRALGATGPVGAGGMKVAADEIEFGLGVMDTVGFDQVNLGARGEIAAVAAQTGMTSGLKVAGNLTLTSQRLTGYQGSTTDFSATGMLTTALVSGDHLPVLAAAPYGGVLNLTGASVVHGGDIEMPYGWLTLTANTGDVKLLAGSKIFTGGLVRSFQGVSTATDVYVPGGSTTLSSTQGNVIVAQGASVDVSGAGGSDAGSLTINAPQGTFSLQGQLLGGVATTTDRPDPWRGAFSLDAMVLDDGDTTSSNDFSSLLAHLSGFGAEFSVRQRTGDLVIAAADTITSERVLLSVDEGVLDIHGKIDAQAPQGGWVLASAGKELYLRDGAVIDATATGSNEPGGEVYLISGANADYAALAANNGALVLEPGSHIQVGGTLAYGQGNINTVVQGTGQNALGQNYYDLRDNNVNNFIDFTQTAPVYYFKGSALNSLGASNIRVRALDNSTVGYALMGADGVTPVAEGEINQGDHVTVELRQIGNNWVFVLVSKTTASADYGTTSAKESPGDLGISKDYSSSYWVYSLTMTKDAAIALDPNAHTTFTFQADKSDNRNGADGSAAFDGVRIRLWEKSQQKDIAIVNNDGSALLPGEIQTDSIVKVVYNQATGLFVLAPSPGGQLHLQAPRMAGATGALYSSLASTFSSNTYTIAYPGASSTVAPQAGTVVSFTAATKNTGNVKITLSGAGSSFSGKSLLSQSGAQLASGAIAAGSTVYALWDGTNFRLVDAAFGTHTTAPSSSNYAVVSAGSTDRYTIAGVAAPVTGSTLAFTVSQMNADAAVKLNVGGTDYSLKTAAGADVGASSLHAGDVVYAYYTGSRYQLTTESNIPLDIGNINQFKVKVAGVSQITAGFTVAFEAKNANSGGSTLQIQDANGNVLLAATPLLSAGSALSSGAVAKSGFVYAYFDGTNFQLMTETQAKHDVGSDVKITSQYGSYAQNGIGTRITGAASVDVVANQVTTQAGGSVDFSNLYADSLRYVTGQAAATTSRLSGSGLGALLLLQPGEEVRSTGDLTVASDVNLGSYRFGNEPGVLTLRAAGQLRFSGSLSDGFSTATSAGTLSKGDSWSYFLASGADLTAADPLAYVQGQGDFVLDGGKLIRTGTGAIQIAAGGNVKIGRTVTTSAGKTTVTYDPTSVIYTAGKASVLEPDFQRPVDTTVPDRFKDVTYPTAGGDLGIEAGGSIYAPAANQVMNSWLVRRGAVDSAGNILSTLTWGIDFLNFNQGVGALGGGNVRVVAAGAIDNLSVSLPTVARDLSTTQAGGDLVETGGGNLDVQATGDILSGIFYVQRGQGRVLSGGEIGAVTGAVDGWSGAATYGRDLLLATGDAPMAAYARQDLSLESVFNPTMAPMSTLVSSTTSPKNNSYFFTYGPDSRVDLVSAQGNLVLNNQTTHVYDQQKQTTLSLTGDTSGYFVYPGTLTAAALNGDLTLAGSFALFPSSTGELHLLARDSVVFAGGISMSDVDPTKLPSLSAPSSNYLGPSAKDLLLSIDPASTDPDLHAATPVHEVVNADGSIWYDPDPVRVYAETGSIISQRSGSSGGQNLIFAKPVEFLAGKDIIDVSLTAQNLSADQTSTIAAGRDVRFAPNRSDYGALVDNGAGIRIGGPGYLDIVTGRNLDLGNTLGVIANGNTANSALPFGGAEIQMQVGMGSDANGHPNSPDYAALLNANTASLALSDLENQFMDYERVRLALLQPENAALSYKDVLNKLENADYRAQMTLLAQPEVAKTLAAFAAQPEKVRAERLYFSELQTASNEASLMKQLTSLGFDLNKLKQLGQPGVAAGFLSTLAGSGLPASSLEKFARFFTDVSNLITAKGTSDVLPELGYSRANQAIARLFPSTDAVGKPIAYKGNFSGFFSQVRTEQASDISLLVPGGSATVGLVSKPIDLTRADSTLGMFTVDGGSVRSYTLGDFQVNTSRVFTLGWEATQNRTDAQRLVRDDLVLFSEDGNIDAGKGAKTTSAAPPPRYYYDSKGNLKIDLSSTISGSGIGVLLARDVIVPGDVYLIAPQGEVNAGDAGIRASGNIFIDANRVVGANNIVSVGLSVGVPVAVSTSSLVISGGNSLGDAARATSDVSSALTGAAENSQKAADDMKKSLANFRPSLISVEVLSFGDDDADKEKKKRTGG